MALAALSGIRSCDLKPWFLLRMRGESVMVNIDFLSILILRIDYVGEVVRLCWSFFQF